jgi:hypothetical protein
VGRTGRGHAGEDDVVDAVLAQLLVEVGVREAAHRPVLAADHVAVPGTEVRVPLTAEGSGRS